VCLCVDVCVRACACTCLYTLLTQVCLHPLQIRSLVWNLDDSKLVSAGTDGAVYEWNLSTGKRETECVLKSCSYNSVTTSPDAKVIFAVGSDQTLKEISDSLVSPSSLTLAAPQCYRRQAPGLLKGSMRGRGTAPAGFSTVSCQLTTL
jgi:WD40 repeat protein